VKRALIAIVDDDTPFATYFRTFLSARGYDVSCHPRGDVMLAAITQGDTPDVALLDVIIPGVDGLDALRALKAAQPALPTTELARQLSEGPDRSLLFWGDSEQMRMIGRIVEQVADSDVTVLLRGESGVGKELVARAVHQRSPRHGKPLVKINCAALPAELLESELFGHEKGAFTGAVTTRIGKFEQADGGTILLDEIAEMKPPLQAKLLHVLQDGEFSRLGSNKREAVDVRILAATNRDLEAMMLDGEFREDLYYRLNVIEVIVPSLRERRDEIAPLCDFFLAKFSRKYKRPRPVVSEALSQLFQTYEWPGNIRELENTIKRLVILQDEQLVVRELTRVPAPRRAYATGEVAVVVALAPPAEVELSSSPTTLLDADATGTDALASRRTLIEVGKSASLKAEREVIELTLREVHGNRRQAALLLSVSYKTVLNKIKEYGLNRY
jgi:two-component system response regulator AtoC